MKKIRKEQIVCITLTLVFLLCSVLFFRPTLFRMIDGFRDLATSVAYYFTRLFGQNVVVPTVTLIPDSSTSLLRGLFPMSWDVFVSKFVMFWGLFVNGENFVGYLQSAGKSFVGIAEGILFFGTLFFLLGFVLYRRSQKEENRDHGKESKPLRLWKKVSGKIVAPVVRMAQASFAYIRNCRRGIWWKIWLGIWIYNLNLGTILLEAVAFYFYFVISFDFAHLYVQVYKFGMDLSVLVFGVPLTVWIVVFCAWLSRFRRKIGIRRLRYFERCNRVFLESLPVVVMVCGSMGTNKTTMLTDMALSQAVIFREKAYAGMTEAWTRFPNFPWQKFENDLSEKMKDHGIYNLATCRRYVRGLRRSFVLVNYPTVARCWARHCRKVPTSNPDFAFGYDWRRFGLLKSDGLKVEDLFDVMERYAQLYFIYTLDSSLLISNYAIRDDEVLCSKGNLPKWDADFFEREPENLDTYSRYAHILDFDVLRPGRKVQRENPAAGSFEFGVVTITEVGKERGNQNDTRSLRRDAAETNRVNDLFNLSLKMARHPGTVDFYPFVKIYTDEQRPESWGADARDLLDLLHIRGKGELKLALPFFAFEEILHDLIYTRFVAWYGDRRYRRGDSTLLEHVFRNLASVLHLHYVKVWNRYGFRKMALERERGTQDSDLAECSYVLMSAKIYAKRFATDCFSELFAEKAVQTEIGLADYPEYATERATFEELKMQNSYFIRDLEHLGEPEEVEAPEEKKRQRREK